MQYHDPVSVGSADPDEQRWQALLAQYQVLSAAAAVAWNALLEAYRPSSDGMIRPQPELLQRYRSACAVRAAAEAELLALLQTAGQGERLTAATTGPADSRLSG